MYNISITYEFDLELPLNEYKKVKNKKGIYFLYDWENNLAYIGKSIRLQRRISDHILNKESNLYNYRYLLSHVKVIYCKNELDMELLETYLINKLKPYLNIDYKIPKIKNKFNAKNIEEKALKYQKQWEEKILKPIEIGAYKRRERIEFFCNQIKQKVLTENLTFPIRVGIIGENFQNFLKKHWNKQNKEINSMMKMHGFIIYEDKNDKRKTKYIDKI
jgi:hypothetical protein